MSTRRWMIAIAVIGCAIYAAVEIVRIDNPSMEHAAIGVALKVGAWLAVGGLIWWAMSFLAGPTTPG